MPPVVALVRYEKPLASVRRAVELSGGLDHLPAKAKVFIKPNVVFWTREVPFPKYGVITTSRVVEDMVVLLKERGIDDITIGEGMVTLKPKDKETVLHAYESLGYGRLGQRYGVKTVDVMNRPFTRLDLGGGVVLNFNQDAVESDFIVDLPVMKAHAQTVVSLGIKNLKGLIDIESRKICHGPDPVKDLNYHIARLADRLPPIFTLQDGLYSNERGPAFDGRMRRLNLLIASADILAGDMVGAKALGHEPAQVPHLVNAARNRGWSLDLSAIEVRGERIEDVAVFHEYAFPYNEEGTLPLQMAKKGIKGVAYRKYDLTMCTYCSSLTGAVLSSVALAWKGQPFDDVEVLTGKIMKPTPGMKKTILLGKCMYEANRDHPDIKEMLAVKSCPPQPKAIVRVLREAGMEINPDILLKAEQMPTFYLARYQGKPEFEEAHFTVAEG
ncbi:MAG: DUF362 domain-containing protein [Thermodesulfobacteriota bacterium]